MFLAIYFIFVIDGGHYIPVMRMPPLMPYGDLATCNAKIAKIQKPSEKPYTCVKTGTD
jgi:hypothetical protein